MFERFFKKDKITEIAEFLAVAIHLDGKDERSELEAAAQILKDIDAGGWQKGLALVINNLERYKTHSNFLDAKERVLEYFEGHIGEAQQLITLMHKIAEADGDYSEKERIFIECIGG